MKNILFTILFLAVAISYGQDSTVTKLSLKGRVFDIISQPAVGVPDDTGSSDGDVLTTDGAGTYTWETIAFPAEIGLACSDEISDLSTGLKLTFRVPYLMTLTDIRASVSEAPTGSTLEVDVQEGGVSVFSTMLTIDNGEETSTTAAIPAVISDTSLANDAEITVIINQVGSTTTGKGLKLWLIGTRSL